MYMFEVLCNFCNSFLRKENTMSLILNLGNMLFVVVRALVFRSFVLSLVCATLFGGAVWYLYSYSASEYGMAFGVLVGLVLTACEMVVEFVWAIRKSNKAKSALAAAHRRGTRGGWADYYRAARAEQHALEAMNFGTKAWTAWHMQAAIDSAESDANYATKQENACRW
jgi:hypothetical protein